MSTPEKFLRSVIYLLLVFLPMTLIALSKHTDWLMDEELVFTWEDWGLISCSVFSTAVFLMLLYRVWVPAEEGDEFDEEATDFRDDTN